MGAAIGGRDGVAIGMDEAIVVGQPGRWPIRAIHGRRAFDLARENLIGDEILALDSWEGSP